jgi:response regulator RpfG family c-di-GMP phosphodiesterase
VLITLASLRPRKDGWEVLCELKEDAVTRDIPVIIISLMEDLERGFSLRAGITSSSPRSRGSGARRRFLTVIQAKNNTNVSVWTKRSQIASIEALTCLTCEDLDQRAHMCSCVLCL